MSQPHLNSWSMSPGNWGIPIIHKVTASEIQLPYRPRVIQQVMHSPLRTPLRALPSYAVLVNESLVRQHHHPHSNFLPPTQRHWEDGGGQGQHIQQLKTPALPIYYYIYPAIYSSSSERQSISIKRVMGEGAAEFSKIPCTSPVPQGACSHAAAQQDHRCPCPAFQRMEESAAAEAVDTALHELYHIPLVDLIRAGEQPSLLGLKLPLHPADGPRQNPNFTRSAFHERADTLKNIDTAKMRSCCSNSLGSLVRVHASKSDSTIGDLSRNGNNIAKPLIDEPTSAPSLNSMGYAMVDERPPEQQQQKDIANFEFEPPPPLEGINKCLTEHLDDKPLVMPHFIDKTRDGMCISDTLTHEANPPRAD